jgi:hypothetical protein
LGAILAGFAGAYPYDGRELVHSTDFSKSSGKSSGGRAWRLLPRDGRFGTGLMPQGAPPLGT